MRRFAVLLFTAGLAGACSGADELDSWEATATDVVSLPNTRASLVAELRIDGYDENLVPTGRIAVRADGAIAVAQPQDATVRFFSADGDALGTFGRSGQGPGEFRVMSDMGWRGDTLWVDDFEQPRLTLISPELSLVRTVPVPVVTGGPGISANSVLPRIRMRALTDSGEFVGMLGFNAAARVEDRERQTIARVTPEGRVAQIVARFPAGEAYARVQGGSVSLPYPNRSYEAVAPSGDRFVAALASLEGPNAGTFRVTAWTVRGDTVFSRRYQFAPVRIPPSEADSVIQARLERLRLRAPPKLVRAFEQGASVPPMYPPLLGLMVGQDHTVWIERRREEDTRRYIVIDPAGAPIGEIAMPIGSRIAAAQRDRIWVLEADELGVQSVVRYGLMWDEPQ